MPALAAKSASGGAVSMRHHSQIANGTASANFRNVREARSVAVSHTATMETAKNGGVNYLQAWRDFRGLTRDELAEKVDTTGAVIWHLEQGERALSAKWLRRLAPALGTTPGFLLDHDPAELPTDMLEKWSAVPHDQREHALQVIETFTRRGAIA